MEMARRLSFFDTYTLGFPNREVEEGVVKFLMPYYTSAEERQTGFEIRHLSSQ